MQKWISLIAVVAVVGTAIALSLPDFLALPALIPRSDAGDAGPITIGDASSIDIDGGQVPLALEALHAPQATETVDEIRDANVPFALPKGTPKSVRCGVILVTFSGAEGAAANSRSREDASALAIKLALEAQTDFRSAAARGDVGSADDIGRIPRGVLEKNLEYTLFTLASGDVSDPVETPRGFWIAKRLD
jgi:hypothetical protein